MARAKGRAIRRVVQRDLTGCGLACVAAIAGVSYFDVRRKATAREMVPDKDGYYYTVTRQLRDLLKAYRVRSGQGRRASSWKPITTLSIVGIKYKILANGHPEWHWVVYVPSETGGYVLDPYPTIKSKRRTDLRRMKPNRFIPIESGAIG